MDKTKNDRLTQFVEQHGGDIDTLTPKERDEADLKIGKAGAFERRDMDEQAETLRQEVADMVGAEEDDSNDDKEDVLNHLSNYDLDTLNSTYKIDNAIQKLEQKAEKFVARNMDKRVQELHNEIEVLESAKDEVNHAKKKYEDIDTLASRIVQKGSVLELTPGGGASSRSTGKTVTLKEADSTEDVDTLSRSMNPREVNRAVSRITKNVFRGGE